MLNLDQAIAEWRRKLTAAGIESTAVLDELENHLRDDFEAQVRSGTDEERAFELAVRRLGQPEALKCEFVKSTHFGPPPRRVFLTVFYVCCALMAVLTDAWTIISFELSPAEHVLASGLLTIFALYLFGLPFSGWWKSRALQFYLLGLMKVLGLLVPLWTLLALLTALRIVRLEIGIVVEMTLWSLCAAYGLTALAWLLNSNGDGPDGSDNGFPGIRAPKLIPPRSPRFPGVDIPVPPSAAFSANARQALQLAREEALTLGHDYIGTEHVLLGLLKAAGDSLAQALPHSRVDAEALRAEIRRLISAGPGRPTNVTLPFTPRARKALQFAGQAANSSKHAPIGAEHILLGLCREGGGLAAMALRNLGVGSGAV